MSKITYSVAQLRAFYHPSPPPSNFNEYERVVGSSKPFSPLTFTKTTNITNVKASNYSSQQLLKSSNSHAYNQNNSTKSQNNFNSNKSTQNWEPTNYKLHQNPKSNKIERENHLQPEEFGLNATSKDENYQNEAVFNQGNNYQSQYNYNSNLTSNNNIPYPYQNPIPQQQQLNLNQNNLSQGLQSNQPIQPIQQVQPPYLMPSQYVNPLLPPFNPLQMQQINLVQPMQFITPLLQMVGGVPFQIPQISPYMNSFQSNYNFVPYDGQPFAMQNNFSPLQQSVPQQFYPEQPTNSFYYQSIDNRSLNIPEKANQSDGGTNFPHLIEQQSQIPSNTYQQQMVNNSDGSDYYYQPQPFTNQSNEQYQQDYYEQPQTDNQFFSSSFSQKDDNYQNDNFGSVLTNSTYEDSGQISDTDFSYCYDSQNAENNYQDNPNNFYLSSKSETPIIENFESVLNISSPNPTPTCSDSGSANDSFEFINFNRNGYTENSFTDDSNSIIQVQPPKSAKNPSPPATPLEFVPVHSKSQFSSSIAKESLPLANQANNENNNINSVDDYELVSKNLLDEKIPSRPTFNPEKLASTSFYVSATSLPKISQAVKPVKRNKYL